MREEEEGGREEKTRTKSITNILCSYDVMSRQLSRLILRRKKRKGVGVGEEEGRRKGKVSMCLP